MQSAVDVANRALQKVGARAISSLDEASREAQEVKRCYDACLRLELQSNFWTFATKRSPALARDSDTPVSGRLYQFSLPADWLREAPGDPTYVAFRTDYLYEGRKVLTDDPGPIYLRYITSDVQPQHYHALFAEALAARIALEIAEPLTQSTSKKEALSGEYTFHINQARKVNAIIAGPITPEEDEWVSARRGYLDSYGYPYRD